MILTTSVDVLAGGRNFKHYKELGYNPKVRVPFVVPIEHLTHGSNVIVSVRCDYCGDTVEKSYKDTLHQRMGVVPKDACSLCKGRKIEESNLKIYGVKNVMDVRKYRDKIKETNLSRYGVENTFLYPEFREKSDATRSIRTDEQKSLTRKKIENTNIKRYGVKCPLTLASSRKNLFKTLERGSSQQKAVYEILLEEFSESSLFYNESYSTLSLDILLDVENVKIDIEYDSWYWHMPRRDRRRDEFLKEEGYKIFRIKSGKLIPEKEDLMIAISKLISETDRKYIEVVLSDWDEVGYRTKQIRGGKL